MAINPLIALQNQRATPNIQPALNQMVAGIRRGPALEERRTNIAESKTKRDRAAREMAMNQFKSIYTGAAQVAPFLQQGDTESTKMMLNRRRSALEEAGINTDHTDQALKTLEQDPTGKTLLGQVSNIIQAGDKLFGSATNLPAAIQERRDLISQLPVDAQGRLKPIDQMTAAEKAIAVEAGLVPRAVGTGAITAATTEGLTDKVSRSEGKIEGGKAAGKQAIEKSGEAFDQLAGVKSNIANYNDAIRLIDEGAETGAVYSKLPSVRASSVELDNVQSRLGLDVIGNTTFGALSEAELKFALSSALPTNLDGPELRAWLVRKRDAQQKLANYLEEAATFLGTPGNTVADFIKMKKQKSGQGGGSDVQTLSDDELLNF